MKHINLVYEYVIKERLLTKICFASIRVVKSSTKREQNC